MLSPRRGLQDAGPEEEDPLRHRHRHPVPPRRHHPSPGVNYKVVNECMDQINSGDNQVTR